MLIIHIVPKIRTKGGTFLLRNLIANLQKEVRNEITYIEKNWIKQFLNIKDYSLNFSEHYNAIINIYWK